jgi:hypothetical protein
MDQERKAAVAALKRQFEHRDGVCNFNAAKMLDDLLENYDTCQDREVKREREKKEAQERADRSAQQRVVSEQSIVQQQREAADSRGIITGFDNFLNQSSVYKYNDDTFLFYLGKETIHLLVKGRQGWASGYGEGDLGTPDSYYLVEMYIFIKCTDNKLEPFFLIVQTKEDINGNLSGPPEVIPTNKNTPLSLLIQDTERRSSPIDNPEESARIIMTSLLGYTQRSSEGWGFRPSTGWVINEEGNVNKATDQKSLSFRVNTTANRTYNLQPNLCIFQGKITPTYRLKFIEAERNKPYLSNYELNMSYYSKMQRSNPEDPELKRAVELAKSLGIVNQGYRGGKKTKNNKRNKKELRKKTKKTKKSKKSKKSKK